MQDHIVVGYDGNAGGADALALAGVLADVARVPTHITVVAAYPHDPAAPALRALPDGYEGALRADAERRLEGARRFLGDRPEVDAVVRRGVTVSAALQRVAAETGAGVLVVGRSHTGPVGRTFVGSVTEQVLGGAPCAVAVAPRGYADEDRSRPEIAVAGLDREGRVRAGDAATVLAAVAHAGLSAVGTDRPARRVGVALPDADPVRHAALPVLVLPAALPRAGTTRRAGAA
ncbi:universal stress protein [Patulibacter americanus]|uniref:universal stress protein n=1 Tax=Patulibacter americanus TaxID=588672 RepID=UPI0003B77352|nr:universal stress protein [Patulibacter americanus]